ncbi:PQQ-dependent sugar dehydrogenase [Flectobacillus roseus]|jgi:glucose/arabinose dehydrogenase|uniref:PQQ-dependent sugar dehydrogenase n=1 Tax=Flectobacillus roseus TaxID=502259 RepID=A0ABT6YB01_9BACT|nr:PQQ-dependent sugar dehydrogenase [Flectobacillus roseus]MDI9860764.1 PQQ-dependent sugar dehydrogenase [Flectobacillus roseus]
MKKSIIVSALFGLLVNTSLLANTAPKKSPKAQKSIKLKADVDNGGLTLPNGIGALVVADGLGKARHLAVAPNGDVYVRLNKLVNGKGTVVLKDTDGDGKADQNTSFGNFLGTGIVIGNGYLYASSDTSVVRYPMKDGKVDESAGETIVTGLEHYSEHGSKSIELDDKGHLYVTFGAPSNACQEKNRQKGSKGMDPCPILEWHGGIWQFDANKKNQKQADGVRYATGLRNVVGLDWNKQQGELYAMQHGRDQLNTMFSTLYNAEQNAELPSEEFCLVKKGSDFGWPYCYHDRFQNKKMLAPEYGGDGKIQERCEGKDQPIMAFPAHWAPNALLFYTGNQLPAKYKNGAFICFHGSWNRAPLKQGGYFVAFVPFGKNGKPSGEYEVFAEGFAGGSEIKNPNEAKARPMGLAQGPDGSLYISDSVKGKVWRVIKN